MLDLPRLNESDGFLPIEDHGLIGDGVSAALVGRDGRVSWLCLPRFDSPAVFCSLLDPDRGGAFTVAPEDLAASAQRYVPGTGVLVTEMSTPSGSVRITDALALRSGADLTEDAPAARGELLRVVEGLAGSVRLRVDVAPRGDGRGEGSGHRFRLRSRDVRQLDVQSSIPLEGLPASVSIRPGDRLHLVLRWGGGSRRHTGTDVEDRLHDTIHAWRRWGGNIAYDGPQSEQVRRSAITLKLLDHFQNGAIVAAPTSSLPEVLGGSRNWDYRYSWIRDAAFSVYALRRVGLRQEAWGFLAWVLDAVERHGGRPHVLYDLDGEEGPEEEEDPDLRGYLGSRPVRWGNAAARQTQHDVFGEILDCAYQWAAGGGDIAPALWSRLRPLIEAAREEWRTPDQGIWEVRTSGRPFTYSAAMCQVALDRGARLAERFGHPGDVEAWKQASEHIRNAILEAAWNPRLGGITQHVRGASLDASVLSLPLRRVIPAHHPKMVATRKAVQERLGAGGGLLYRYLPEESPDGLPGKEGAFLLCSFWLVDNLGWQGKLDEAVGLYERLCARTNALGLLPEQIDPASGRFLGNFPQALSHVGLISSGVTLTRLIRRRRDGELASSAALGHPDGP